VTIGVPAVNICVIIAFVVFCMMSLETVSDGEVTMTLFN